jgi:hypothetical protein
MKCDKGERPRMDSARTKCPSSVPVSIFQSKTSKIGSPATKLGKNIRTSASESVMLPLICEIKCKNAKSMG